MATAKRTLAELAKAAKNDPSSLTPGEMKRLRAELERRKLGPGADRKDYERIKEEARARRASSSRAGRDIGELPPVADPARKAAGLANLRTFCETYFRSRFPLAWSPNHIAVIDTIQRVAIAGGREAKAVERGFGKTSILEVATLWGVFRGHAYALLTGASKAAGLEMLESIKGELEDNELLAADFPEVCYPIQCLEGISNRCAGQLYQGKRTRISITKEELQLPTIPGSPASGAIIRVVGILGRIRGRKKRLVRPSFVLLDDPQTDTSAKSLSQTEKREQIIVGAVLGLAGPNKQISVFMAGTVIKRNDLMDRFLAADRHVDWIKTRFKLMPAFPTAMRLWEQYWTMRTDEIRNGGDGAQATAFYRDRRAEMDAGAVVSWAQRFKPGELSAVQHAMNLFFSNPEAFAAEMQNDPEDAVLGEGQLVAADLLQRCNGLERGVAPQSATRLTAFIDLKHKILHWMVCAWADDFTGAILDYGTYPDQGRKYFMAAEAQITLQHLSRGGLQASILAGLNACAGLLLDREWKREGGQVLKIGRLLVDAKLGDCTDTVHAFCRRSPHSAIILPSDPRFVGAKSKPWHLYQKREGERLGLHWLIKPHERRATRFASIDVNYWKTFVRDRLVTAVGDRGALTFYGQPGLVDHRLLADHLCAEYCVEVSARDRTVLEWSLRPEKFDNDWFDSLVGCAAAASIEGAQLLAEPTGKKRISLREMQQKHLGEKNRQLQREARGR